MASHRRLHCLLNRLFRQKTKKTQSSVSLAFVRGPRLWPVDSPYGFPLQRASNAENVCIWWHHLALCFQPGDRNLFWDMFVIQVNSAICLMAGSWCSLPALQISQNPLKLSNLGTHLVVSMAVIIHVSHWYRSHNIMHEIRWKAKAILPPNIMFISDGTKTISLYSSIWNYIKFLNINVVSTQVCFIKPDVHQSTDKTRKSCRSELCNFGAQSASDAGKVFDSPIPRTVTRMSAYCWQTVLWECPWIQSGMVRNAAECADHSQTVQTHLGLHQESLKHGLGQLGCLSDNH